MSQTSPDWLVFVWRLPTGGSTDRVWMWRTLRRLGAVSLTPGGAVVPFSDELQEQLDWLAQEAEQHGGDAWVLPVVGLSDKEARRIREQSNADRSTEYQGLREEAMDFLRRAADHPGPDGGYSERLRTEKELVALQRRFHKIRTRDYFSAPGRREAAATIDRCLAFRQGISRKLVPVTDPAEEGQHALHHA